MGLYQLQPPKNITMAMYVAKALVSVAVFAMRRTYHQSHFAYTPRKTPPVPMRKGGMQTEDRILAL